MLGSNYMVDNFGVSGSTVSLSSYKPYMDQPEFKSAEDFQPNIVVIMLGTNDAHSDLQQYNGTFEQDYVKLITSFQQLPSKPQVLIVESPPVYNNTLDLSPTFFSQTIIPKIEAVANQLNLPIVDVYDAFGNHSNYTIDGVHPNSEGASLIASEVYSAIVNQTTRP
jgi:lysophospholipase L1-like esterase